MRYWDLLFHDIFIVRFSAVDSCVPIIPSGQLNEIINEDILRKYEQKYEDWEQLQKVANEVIAGNTQAYIYAINQISPFRDIRGLKSVDLYTYNSRHIEADLHITIDIIPIYKKTLL